MNNETSLKKFVYLMIDVEAIEAAVEAVVEARKVVVQLET